MNRRRRSSVRIFCAPPELPALTRSWPHEHARSLAPRGAFCFGLLTSHRRKHLHNRAQTAFCSKPVDLSKARYASEKWDVLGRAD